MRGREWAGSALPPSASRSQKLQDVAFPRKDQLKKLLHEKYNREHTEYMKNQVRGCVTVVTSGAPQILQYLHATVAGVGTYRNVPDLQPFLVLMSRLPIIHWGGSCFKSTHTIHEISVAHQLSDITGAIKFTETKISLSFCTCSIPMHQIY